MPVQIISGKCEPRVDLFPGIEVRDFACAAHGATNLSTGTATLAPSATIPDYRRAFSEAITILAGEAFVETDGRRHGLGPFDCIHIPRGIRRSIRNASVTNELLFHWACASADPHAASVRDDDADLKSTAGHEHIARFSSASPYELAANTRFYDLFAGRYGSVGICGGYGRFEPSSSLPCHVHEYDESITIVEGEATCEVMGQRYTLTGCDTAFIPQGLPHRFLNHSSKPMAMIWVYAGSEPMRAIVNASYCTGSLPWLGSSHADFVDSNDTVKR